MLFVKWKMGHLGGKYITFGKGFKHTINPNSSFGDKALFTALPPFATIRLYEYDATMGPHCTEMTKAEFCVKANLNIVVEFGALFAWLSKQ